MGLLVFLCARSSGAGMFAGPISSVNNVRGRGPETVAGRVAGQKCKPGSQIYPHRYVDSCRREEAAGYRKKHEIVIQTLGSAAKRRQGTLVATKRRTCVVRSAKLGQLMAIFASIFKEICRG